MVANDRLADGTPVRKLKVTFPKHLPPPQGLPYGESFEEHEKARHERILNEAMEADGIPLGTPIVHHEKYEDNILATSYALFFSAFTFADATTADTL